MQAGSTPTQTELNAICSPGGFFSAATSSVSANGLSFRQYARQADTLLLNSAARPPQVSDDCILELTHLLDFIFDGQYEMGLLQRGLLALNPNVWFCAVAATSQAPARGNYPSLSDAATDELADWCDEQLRGEGKSQGLAFISEHGRLLRAV